MLILIMFFALLLITLVFFLMLSSEKKEKEELFHMMAHKFRSPISIIKWYVELLSDKSVGNFNDKQREYFTEIYKGSEKLNEIIDNLIVFLQLQSNKITIKTEEVKIKTLITQIVNKLQFKIQRHGLRLQEIYPKDKEIVAQVDPKLLGIVLENIIENAIKYTSENGNIDLKVDFFNQKLLIEIKYSGYVISNRKKLKMSADSVTHKETSFSLYFVKLILKRMQSRIEFKSEKSKGTTFSIVIPA